MEKMTEEQKQLVEGNLGLVYHIMITRFSGVHRGTDLHDEMTQEGFLQLCECTYTYDEDKSNNAKFASYAVACCYFRMLAHMMMSRPGFNYRTNTGYQNEVLLYLDKPVQCKDDSDEVTLGDIVAYNYETYESDFNFIDETIKNCFIKAAPVQGEKIYKLRRRGLPYQEIGDKLGISKQRVGSITNKAKVMYKREMCKYDI